MNITHASLVEIQSMLTQALADAGDQVRLVETLAKRVRELPPPNALLKSRPKFARAALQTYPANFFEMPENVELTKQIRIAHDCRIRGVQVAVLPALEFDQTPDSATWWTAAHMRALLNRYGQNWRAFVDVRWRIEDYQGFITDGYAAVVPPATMVSGDGVFSADLDWTLKRDQHIVVDCTNRISRIVDPECETYFKRELPWVAVVFWAERDE
jgi:hypothetical protein